MSEQYTPTTDDVRLEYMAVRWGKNDTVSFEARAEFDRWLAEVERAAAEKAWDEGYQEANQDLWREGGREGNPYRTAALGLTAGQKGETA